MSNVKKLREQAGLSKIALAKQAKISRQYLADIEIGAAMPSVVIASRIAKKRYLIVSWQNRECP